MSVSFAENLVEIKEYEYDYSEKAEKQQALKKIKRNQNTQIYMIRNILYKSNPTEEKFVEKRNNGSRGGGISFIEGYLEEYSSYILYKDHKRMIEYNIYLNNFNKMVAEITTRGFGPVKHHIKYYSSGCLFEDMHKAEYKSKMYVIETARKLLNENDIM